MASREHEWETGGHKQLSTRWEACTVKDVSAASLVGQVPGGGINEEEWMTALAGKAVVVTGAGKGLGRAYALLAAAEGASVVVNDIDRACTDEVVDAICSTGGKGLASYDDISSWTGSDALISASLDSFGQIDGLINNAGLFYMARPDQEEPERIEALMRVNVLGTAFCGIHALRIMMAQGSGAIVNVTSGAHAGYCDMAMYGASKGAAASLTYGWASDVAGTGVRVNAIAPVAKTQMYQQMLNHQGARSRPGDTKVRPEDNAAVAIYLLSDAAVGINGQIFRVDVPRLSVLGHPAEVAPSAVCENWTVETVGEAVSRDLGVQFQPLGLQTR